MRTARTSAEPTERRTARQPASRGPRWAVRSVLRFGTTQGASSARNATTRSGPFSPVSLPVRRWAEPRNGCQLTYEIATPPLDRALDKSTRKEVLAYSECFFTALPTRVEMLQEQVAATRGYKSWRADSSVESLERLGRWFESQVESTASPTEPSPSNAAVFEMSVEELEALESGLSGRTLSLCRPSPAWTNTAR